MQVFSAFVYLYSGHDAPFFFSVYMLYFVRCHPYTWQWRGGAVTISTFILSIMAGVIANYISKWLDERADGNEPRR